MTATMTNNGTAPRTRRQLNDSIAKMDSLIDGLADAIPSTIKDVLEENVSTAIAEGIKAAVLEVLSNPDLLKALQGNVPPGPPAGSPGTPILVPMPRPSLVGSLIGKAGSAVTNTAGWCRDQVVTAARSIADTAHLLANKAAALRQRMWLLRFLPKSLIVTLTVGGVVAAAALLAPSWSVAVLGCLGAAVATGIAKLAMWFRKATRPLYLGTD